MNDLEKNCLISVLQRGLAKMEHFDSKFVPYNTKFIYVGTEDNCIVKGKSTKKSKETNEFCFGRDGDYGQTHLLDVYIMAQVAQGMAQGTGVVANLVLP